MINALCMLCSLLDVDNLCGSGALAVWYNYERVFWCMWCLVNSIFYWGYSTLTVLFVVRVGNLNEWTKLEDVQPRPPTWG